MKYISTEIAEGGKRMVLHLESRRNTAEEACPYCGGHICGSCSMRLKDMPINPGTKQDIEIAYHRYRLPELCKELLRGDSIQVSWGEDNGACCLMDKRFLASQHTDLHRPEDHWGSLGYDKADTEGDHG